jgi:hypothetical protein
MTDNDAFKVGEEMARAWTEGRSELIEDLGALVAGMGEIGPQERGFLVTLGNAARAARRAPRPTPAPALLEAQTPAAPPARAPIDVDDSWRRARERMRQARLEELARANSQISLDIEGVSWRRRPGDDWS